MDVEAINTTDGFALLENGEALPITDWLDEYGDDCEPEHAVVCVAGPDASGQWYSIGLSGFEQRRLH